MTQFHLLFPVTVVEGSPFSLPVRLRRNYSDFGQQLTLIVWNITITTLSIFTVIYCVMKRTNKAWHTLMIYWIIPMSHFTHCGSGCLKRRNLKHSTGRFVFAPSAYTLNNLLIMNITHLPLSILVLSILILGSYY